ncbi:CPCC family cysteine-rich protein [Bacillus sp. FJAT-42315]|uniref:CPCC family cysteine-rich protein n=1 Tax=Bacillus sp. FJAT-42315 TaxID=2014077 RepID=UPI001E4665D0|nr:CPCC family cysteine-rich protein [Bacillus sp. FJAT-42315]
MPVSSEICFWEDDIVQFNDSDYEGGANEVSLRQAPKNFNKLGACEKVCIQSVRKNNEQDIKDHLTKNRYSKSQ